MKHSISENENKGFRLLFISDNFVDFFFSRTVIDSTDLFSAT